MIKKTPYEASKDFDYLRFHVEDWGTGEKADLEGVICASESITVARAAFEAAVKEFPKKRIMLCNKMQIIMRNFDDLAERRAREAAKRPPPVAEPQ